MQRRVCYRLRALGLVCAMTLGAGRDGWAADAADEPQSPSAPAVHNNEATQPPSEPTNAEMPASTASGEPGTSANEPAATASEPSPATTEAAAAASPNDPAPATETENTPPAAQAASASYGLGVQARAIFVPTWLLNLFLDASTPLNSGAFGLEFIRRKGNFDIIGSVDFGFYSPRDGNYLGNGENPATKTDYVHFKNLNALAFAAHFIRHEELLPWLSFVWGGGVGVAVVLGSVYRASNSGCTKDNASDVSQCHPVTMTDPSHPERWLNDPANQGTKAQDSPANPKLFKEGDVPPVIPLIHMLVGLNFKVTESFNVRVDGGFQNAFYAGASTQYFF